LHEFMRDFSRDGRAALPAAPGTADFAATSVNVSETFETIRAVYRESGYVADPHTAVGLAAARRHPVAQPTVCLATAHPAKFPEAVDEAIGAPLARHERLERLRGLPSRTTEIPASLDAVKAFLEAHATHR